MILHQEAGGRSSGGSRKGGCGKGAIGLERERVVCMMEQDSGIGVWMKL